jgi:hypothetical protein
MPPFCDKLSTANVNDILAAYLASVEHLGESIGNLRGIHLFDALKRNSVGSGPYPGVSLFEAANRIMTDLVILYGVKWLLKNSVFPFDAYDVEYGNEDKKGFDIRAEAHGTSLIGEAFNVAPSFFQGKKCSMLKKLRKPTAEADFKIIMFNHEAVRSQYVPQTKEREFFVGVNVGTDEAWMVPKSAGNARDGSRCANTSE